MISMYNDYEAVEHPNRIPAGSSRSPEEENGKGRRSRKKTKNKEGKHKTGHSSSKMKFGHLCALSYM